MKDRNRETPESSAAGEIRSLSNPADNAALRKMKDATPARIAVGRAGSRPTTREMLNFRVDHASAVDAVYSEVPAALLDRFGLHSIQTASLSKEDYLRRPDEGRVLSAAGAEWLRENCVRRPQVQIVVSDGLSANAITANLGDVLPALYDSLTHYGLSRGTTFYVERGRVACMDPIGDALQPEALVLLIGERPGLVCSSSMSAYMCYRPCTGTLESRRNVISNIHRSGTPPVEAGAYIGAMLKAMIEQETSGVGLVMP
ncbi:ethanolamine ammonia-lyase subunit EutC [Cohnella algarum]|uniref:ethanolamine ammonia-lyase subunit EutC n=1 Tax=Cohnella algarum TaxID=2044859 RepID=UPI0019672885|nr:ethanolamine ammonia-lyase subunit EutC [Cohnella algarum]MBN2984426.1 ethanolamine ammonia-lyase subunit EutC [Cohnella algarum]